MRFLRATSLVAVLGLVLVSQTGCLAVAAAAGAGAGVAYVRGDTDYAIDGNPHQVSVAAEQALMEMGMVVISNRVSPAEAEIVARNGRDEKIEITARPRTDGRSHVSIRVGVFGNETLQRDLLDRIRGNLASAPAEIPSAPTDN